MTKKQEDKIEQIKKIATATYTVAPTYNDNMLMVYQNGFNMRICRIIGPTGKILKSFGI